MGNWDELSDESKMVQEKTVFVSKQENEKEVVFISDKNATHVTFLFTIIGDGQSLATMIIIKQATVDDDLLKFCMVDGPISYIESTQNGYIVEDVLLSYIKKCIIPYFEYKRKVLGLDNERCLILQDGCHVHMTDKVKKLLDESKIDTFNFLPHSSHLCQPLDATIFSKWKIFTFLNNLKT